MDKELTPLQAKTLEVLENKRFWMIILTIGIVVIGIAVAKFFKQESGSSTERLASEKLFEVEKLEGEGLKSSNRLFSQEFVKLRMEWTPEKKEQMKKILGELVTEFPKTNAAQAGRLRLAALSFQDAKYDDALKQYDDVIANGNKLQSDISTFTAQLGKGYTLEALNKPADALALYDGIAANDKNPVAGEALLSKVRVLRILSREKETEPILKKLENEYPGTYYEEAARVYDAGLAR